MTLVPDGQYRSIIIPFPSLIHFMAPLDQWESGNPGGTERNLAHVGCRSFGIKGKTGDGGGAEKFQSQKEK